MRGSSQRFKDALGSGFVVASKLQVLSNDLVILDSELDENLYINDGEIVMDRSSNNRRSLTLTVADPSRNYLPTSAESYFHPLSGNNLKVFRGMKFPDGTTEMFSQGVFDIATCDITDAPGDKVMDISGFDRSRRIQRNQLVRDYTVAQNTNTVTAIRDLVSFSLGWTPTFLSTPTAHTTNYTRYNVQTDPWTAIGELAEAIGYEVFFNTDGACVIQPIPNPATGTPAWIYEEGVDAIVSEINVHLTSDEAYNGVFAYGQSSYNITPAFGEAWDTNPASPTYSGYDLVSKTFSYSRYGRYPKFLSPNANIKTNAQAREAAEGKLKDYSGVPQSIEFVSVVNPMHEESDLISIKRAETGTDALYILDRFNIPLTAVGGMNARTRERRT